MSLQGATVVVGSAVVSGVVLGSAVVSGTVDGTAAMSQLNIIKDYMLHFDDTFCMMMMSTLY